LLNKGSLVTEYVLPFPRPTKKCPYYDFYACIYILDTVNLISDPMSTMFGT